MTSGPEQSGPPPATDDTIPFLKSTRQKLIDAMLPLPRGTSLTDEELRNICGKDCSPGGDGYSALRSAIKHLRRVHGIDWERVKNENRIASLQSVETASRIPELMQSVRRRTNTIIQRAGTVRLSELPTEDRKKFTYDTCWASFVKGMLDTKVRKLIEAKEVNKPPDMTTYIAALLERGRVKKPET